jgi:hypothetical protein
MYSYSYSSSYPSSYTTTTVDSGAFAAVAGLMAFIWIFVLIIAVIGIIANWKIFTKAGEEGWKSIIPIYNYVTLLKIVGINPLWILALLVPFVGGIAGLILSIATYLRLSQGFGKSTGFAIGLIFVPFVFLLILAFDKSTWNASAINRDTLAFLNDKSAPAAGSAAQAQPQQNNTQDPWVNGQ